MKIIWYIRTILWNIITVIVILLIYGNIHQDFQIITVSILLLLLMNVSYLMQEQEIWKMSNLLLTLTQSQKIKNILDYEFGGYDSYDREEDNDDIEQIGNKISNYNKKKIIFLVFYMIIFIIIVINLFRL